MAVPAMDGTMGASYLTMRARSMSPKPMIGQHDDRAFHHRPAPVCAVPPSWGRHPQTFTNAEVRTFCPWYGIDLANALDKFKAFTPKHHVRRVSSKPRKISRMRLAPVVQRAITFTLVISKRLIDFIKTTLRQFNRLEDGFRSPLPIQDYHQLANFRTEQSLTFCPARRALCSGENKLKEPVRQIGIVAK